MSIGHKTIQPGIVTFVGAGPGSLDLLTIRGARAIGEAALVIYAGSLVSPGIAELARHDAIVRDSSGMTLEECHELVKSFACSGKCVARVHTGDPSIYGALAEQTALLDRDNIPWRIIPGVTAAMAAAAAARASLSNPGLSQSLLITRIAGRTPMPDNEKLADLAKHGINMAIYLAGPDSAELQNELQGAMPKDTPVICVSRASWPDEKIIQTTIGNLAECCASNNIGRQTVFLIMPHLERDAGRSCLYNGDFSHNYRKGKKHGQTGN